MTNNDITKIYFCGDEIAALYQGSTLIFKKSEDVPPVKYTVRGTLKPDSTVQSIQLSVNGINEQIDINEDKTFEHTFVNVPVTRMNNFTSACKDELKTLDLSSFDTSQVTSMNEAFYKCQVESLNFSNLDTSNVTYMNSMFYSCNRLKLLDVSNFNTSNVKHISGMFFYDIELIDLYLNFDVSSVKNFDYIFTLDNKLTNVVGKFEGTKYDLDLASCPLTAASAMVFINGLATVTTTRTLKLSATTYDSLTPEQIAIATAKGWTVTRS